MRLETAGLLPTITMSLDRAGSGQGAVKGYDIAVPPHLRRVETLRAASVIGIARLRYGSPVAQRQRPDALPLPDAERQA